MIPGQPIREIVPVFTDPVSYTHLDVYKRQLPTHVEIAADGNGLSKNSVVLLEQLRTIDKKRLKERIGTINQDRLPDVDEALGVSLGITNSFE